MEHTISRLVPLPLRLGLGTMHLPLVGLKQGWPSKLISTLLTYNLNVHGLPTPLNIGLHFGHVAAAHHLATEDLELGLSLLALAGPLLMHLTISM